MTEREEFEYKTRHPEQTDFKLLAFRYTRYWYLFVLGVILSIFFAVLYLLLSTPQYQISTSIKIRGLNRDPDYQSGSPGFRRLDVYDEGTSLEDEIEALRSISLMERVLDELELTTSYFAKKNFTERELSATTSPVKLVINRLNEAAYKKELSIQFIDKKRFTLEDELNAKTEHRIGQEISMPYGSFTVLATPLLASWDQDKPIKIQFNKVSDLASYYLEQITVVQVGEESSILNVSMLHPDPVKGKAILNKLIELYNRETREDRNRLARNTLGFIDDRLKNVTTELAAVEENVEAFRRANQVTVPTADAAAYLEESRVYDRELSELNIQIEVLESLNRYLAQRKEQFELVPSNLNISDPTLLDLITRFNELQLERERRLRNVEPSNPLLQNINQQLINLRRDLLENLQVIKKGLLVKRENVSQKAGNFRSKIQQAPGIERELNEINRQLGVMQDLYTFLLQKREESALSLASTTSNIRIIDPATASKKPVTPNKPVVLLMAIVLGLVLPFAGLFAKDFLNTSVKLRKEVEQLTNSPIVGEIPHLKNTKKWIALHQSGSPFAQHLELLVSNLQIELPETGCKALLLTSGKKGEGKTFLAKNLALTLSQAGNKVALLECDVREPSLLKELGINKETGITDFLANNQLPIEDILVQSSIHPELFVIGSGPIPSNPGVIFSNPKLGELMADLRDRFDFVLVDTSPAGQTADAYALAPLVDLTIYIIKYNYTLKSEVSTIDEGYVKKKLNQPVLLLNDARKMNSRAIS